MFHLNSSLTCALISSPVSYSCQAVKFGYWYRKNKPGALNNTCYFFMHDKSIRKYSSCELRPQQDFSFRLMCFKSFSEGNLYLLTCISSHKTRRMVNVTEYDHNSLCNIELHLSLAQNHPMPSSIAINKVCYQSSNLYSSIINLYPGIYCT